MGYYTEYSMEVIGIDSEEELDRLTDTLVAKGLIGYVFDNPFFWSRSAKASSRFRNLVTCPTAGPQKWYEYEDDMKEISGVFPDATFRVFGAGEDPGDIWKHYFKNGESEFCPYIPTMPKAIGWPQDDSL